MHGLPCCRESPESRGSTAKRFRKPGSKARGGVAGSFPKLLPKESAQILHYQTYQTLPRPTLLVEATPGPTCRDDMEALRQDGLSHLGHLVRWRRRWSLSANLGTAVTDARPYLPGRCYSSQMALGFGGSSSLDFAPVQKLAEVAPGANHCRLDMDHRLDHLLRNQTAHMAAHQHLHFVDWSPQETTPAQAFVLTVASLVFGELLSEPLVLDLHTTTTSEACRDCLPWAKSLRVCRLPEHLTSINCLAQ